MRANSERRNEKDTAVRAVSPPSVYLSRHSHTPLSMHRGRCYVSAAAPMSERDQGAARFKPMPSAVHSNVKRRGRGSGRNGRI